MYKKVFGKKLSRNTTTRKALFRSLIGSLVRDGKIKTTKVKAKAIQADVDKLMTLVVKNDISAKRLLMSKLANDVLTVEKLFSKKEIIKNRKSGFTKITNLPNRKGDNAPMVIIEFIDIESEKSKK